jgi:hypothetical protein
MSAWLVALLVWVAVGARVGRVLVRPATTIRMAIVVAVIAVAGAVTMAIPDVAQAIDEAGPVGAGMNGASLSASLGTSLWVCFAGAVTAIAIAAWPLASQRNLRRIAVVTYAAAAIVVCLTFVWSPSAGWVVVALTGVFIVVTGLRNLVWSPLGRSIAIVTGATALVAVLAVVQVVDPPPRAPGDAPFAAPGWVWSLAGVAIAIGSVWLLVEVWIRARLLLRRTRALHRSLTDRFPEVVISDGYPRTTTVLRAADHVAHIMDALYLQSGGGIGSARPIPPPQSSTERAAVVAGWVHDPVRSPTLDAKWVTPPEGMSARRWVVAVARAYTGGAYSRI